MSDDIMHNRSDEPVKTSWYVIQVKPTSEDNVGKHLRNAGIESFVPKIKSTIRGSKRPMSRVKCLFPSYVFANTNLRDPNLHHMIRFTRGVRKILGDGERPVPVPSEMIEMIKERINEDGMVEQKITMKKGDKVKIRTGFFADLEGILEKSASSEGRVKVLLKIMQHQVKCELSAADIEKAGD